jgi:hypothetical protein
LSGDAILMRQQLGRDTGSMAFPVNPTAVRRHSLASCASRVRISRPAASVSGTGQTERIRSKPRQNKGTSVHIAVYQGVSGGTPELQSYREWPPRLVAPPLMTLNRRHVNFSGRCRYRTFRCGLDTARSTRARWTEWLARAVSLLSPCNFGCFRTDMTSWQQSESLALPCRRVAGVYLGMGLNKMKASSDQTSLTRELASHCRARH